MQLVLQLSVRTGNSRPGNIPGKLAFFPVFPGINPRETRKFPGIPGIFSIPVSREIENPGKMRTLVNL